MNEKSKYVLNFDFKRINSRADLRNGFKQFRALTKNSEIKEIRYRFSQHEEHSIAYYATRRDGMSVVFNAISGTVETMKLDDWLCRFHERLNLTN